METWSREIESIIKELYGVEGSCSNCRAYSSGAKYAVYEKENERFYSFELPRVKKENISIEYKDGWVIIKATKTPIKENSKVFYDYQDNDKVEYSFKIDSDCFNVNTLESTLEDGELVISVKKIEEKAPTKIKIK